MSKQYKNTVRPTHETRQAAPPPGDKHDAPSRLGALFRLGFALLVLTLMVCTGPFMGRVKLPVVHGEGDVIQITAHTDQTTEYNDVCTASQINADVGSTLIFTTRAHVKMISQSGLLGLGDLSEIEAYKDATIHLHGEITGEFDRLSISTLGNTHFYIHLYDGAVFSAKYNKTLNSSSKDIECIGCNFDSNHAEFVSVVNAAQKNIKHSRSVPSENGVADGHFNQNDPGTMYTFTATSDSPPVVWTKGRGGEELTEGTDVTVDDERQVNVSCRANAKFQVYAFFLPDPEWHWNEDHTEATVKIYSYDPTKEPDLTSYKIYDANSTPPVTIEGNKASITIDGKTYTNTYTDPGNGTGNGTGNGNGNGTGTNGTDPNRYKFTLDSVFTWKRQTNGGMPVVVKDTVGDDSTTYDKLVAVYVDGTRLTRDVHYTATRGSINITLHQDYLKTLSVGTHTLYVELTDGYVQNIFTITASSNGSDPEKGDSPKTGEEDGSLIFYVWLVIVSFGGVGSLLVLKKKMKRAYR